MPPTLPTQYASERLLLRRYRPVDAPANFRMLRAEWQDSLAE